MDPTGNFTGCHGRTLFPLKCLVFDLLFDFDTKNDRGTDDDGAERVPMVVLKFGRYIKPMTCIFVNGITKSAKKDGVIFQEQSLLAKNDIYKVKNCLTSTKTDFISADL